MKRCQFLTTIIVATAMSFLFTAPELRAQGHTKGRRVAPSAATLKAGDYVWHPEVSPAGPVVVLVSLPDQILYVYRNGVRIGRSTVSSGKPGKQTPTGVFTVLQKKVRHESSKGLIWKRGDRPSSPKTQGTDDRPSSCHGASISRGNISSPMGCHAGSANRLTV